MKLVRYGPSQQEKPGILSDEQIIYDLSPVVPDIAGNTLLPQNLEKIRSYPLHTLPKVEQPVRLGACIGQVGKIIGIGLNYADHAKETGVSTPQEPFMFSKATSAISGPFDPILIPPQSTHTDWEVELGIVIGKPGKYIQKSQAHQHIAGYCIVHDVSERFLQKERGGEWFKGKSSDTFAPIGPWLVTPDEIPNPQKLHLWLEVDGVRHQNGNTENMIFPILYLVSYVSEFMSLQSGDIITTGTPAGVGAGKKPPQFLTPGQKIRLSVEGLGEQSCHTLAYHTLGAGDGI